MRGKPRPGGLCDTHVLDEKMFTFKDADAVGAILPTSGQRFREEGRFLPSAKPH